MSTELGIVVRRLSSPSEFQEAEDVQAAVWGVTDSREIVPKHIMIAMHDSGGLALGAFDRRKMVGFAIMMAGYLHGTPYLYSHMTGVVSQYQSKGVGYLLKRKQRDFAMERGFKLIAWTFDPIIAKNAYFNLGKLGAISRNFHANYYGEMRDSINYGWPTDRILAEWHLDPAVKAKIDSSKKGGGGYSPIRTKGAEPSLECVDWKVDLKAPYVRLRIPGDIVGLKEKNPSQALRWREATREVFTSYFGAGFAAVAVSREVGATSYVLTKAELPRNIFAG